MTINWVLGGGGLLGAALLRALRQLREEVYVPSVPFQWQDELALAHQIKEAVAEFALLAGIHGKWRIFWAAGVGTMGASATILTAETLALSSLLAAMRRERNLREGLGQIMLASSAGAIYAGSDELWINENSTPAPTTPYANAKLEQEALCSDFALATGQQLLIARLSTLYGPGQSGSKPQGLLANIARSILRNQPAQIFVPYDTVRDYLAADDAAQAIIETLALSFSLPLVVTKIFASGQPVTIAEIIATYKRLTRQQLRILITSSPLSDLYKRRLAFRSVVPPISRLRAPQSLAVGIARLIEWERSSLTSTSLPSGFLKND